VCLLAPIERLEFGRQYSRARKPFSSRFARDYLQEFFRQILIASQKAKMIQNERGAQPGMTEPQVRGTTGDGLLLSLAGHGAQ